MQQLRWIPTITLALGLAALGGAAHAQDGTPAAPMSRAQVKMDTVEFIKTHRWDGLADNWVLKDGVEPPIGIKTRAEVMAETTAFLRLNRWDDPSDSWVSLRGQPREMSTLSRAQVKAETVAFARTHNYDEVAGAWVAKPRSAKP